MTDPLPNPDLDALLRGVPVPPEMLARLRAMSQWSDDELDRGLRQVDVPQSLRTSLRSIPEDVALDARLQATPGEAAALGRLNAICAGIPNEIETEWLEEVDNDPSEVTPRTAHTLETAATSTRRWFAFVGGLLSVGIVSLLSGWYLVDQHLKWVHDRYTFETVVINADDCEDNPLCPDDSILPWLAGLEILDKPNPTDLVAPQIAFQDRELLQAPASAREISSVLAVRDLSKTKFELLFPESFIGDPQRSEVPDLKEVTPWLSRGSAVPVVRGFDRTFLWKHGVNPFVSPVANPVLTTSEAPLSGSTASFDALRQSTVRGELPAAGNIFVEDFLASVESPFPKARAGMVEIRTAAGPAIFAMQRPALADGPQLPANDGTPRLLQVQVETGSSAHRASPATYLTIAVDVSARMRWGGRIDDCRRAILAAAKQLGPRDRLAIVAMGEECDVLMTEVPAGDLDALREVLDRLQASGPLNLSEGLRVAAKTVLEPNLESDVSRRIVVVTGGVERFDDATKRRVHELLATLVDQKVACDFCDTSGYPSGHPLLADLAMKSGGKSSPIASASDLRWQLVESLTGSSSVVAVDAKLRVKFNPKSVAAWRLIGNEAQIKGGSTESELRAGQSAMLLYEVWLTGNDNDIATADLVWRDAVTGENHRATQPISRLQFAATWEESALPLQAASIAAESAEVLRESYFASARNRTLSSVLERAEQVNRRLASHPDFQSFVSVLKSAEEIRSGRFSRDRD